MGRCQGWHDRGLKKSWHDRADNRNWLGWLHHVLTIQYVQRINQGLDLNFNLAMQLSLTKRVCLVPEIWEKSYD
jgi:hypothetical protein